MLETQIPALMDLLPKTSDKLVDDQGNQIAYNVPIPNRQYSRRSSGLGNQSWNTGEDETVVPSPHGGLVPTPPTVPPPRRESQQYAVNPPSITPPRDERRGSTGGVSRYVTAIP